MKNMIKVLLLCVVSVMLFTGCEEMKKDFGLADDSNAVERSCTINIDSEDKDNLNSYSFDLYLDGEKLSETVKKGGSTSMVKSLKDGHHKLKAMIGVTSSEEVTFTVSESATSFKFGCSKKDSVSVDLHLK